MLRLSAIFLIAGLALGAQSVTVASFYDTVRAAIRSARSDADIAGLIADTKLTERLDAAVAEQLETEGAGPQAMRALELQQELTASLPVPKVKLKVLPDRDAPSEQEQKIIIEQAREAALNYTSSLPNFLCTQTVTRFTGSPADWKVSDTLVMSVAYTSKGEHYKLLQVDGKPTRKTLTELGGFHSNGEFGSLLKSVFRPEAETVFHWERWTNLHGRMAHVFSFHIEQNRSNYQIGWKGLLRRIDVYVALDGWAYVDAETHSILRLVANPQGPPPESPIRNVHGVLEYGTVEIGGRSYTLPTRTENRIWLRTGQRNNVSVFDRYRKFAGESTISFEPASPER